MTHYNKCPQLKKLFFFLKHTFCDSFVSFYIPDALHIMMMEIKMEKKNDIGIKNRNKRKQKNKNNGIDIKCLLRQETEMALVYQPKGAKQGLFPYLKKYTNKVASGLGGLVGL